MMIARYVTGLLLVLASPVLILHSLLLADPPTPGPAAAISAWAAVICAVTGIALIAWSFAKEVRR